MAVKKNTYSEVELDWAESQLASWKKFIDDHPVHEMKDRIEWKPTSKGGMLPMVISSIETQIKSITELMQKYLLLLKEVDAMREIQEKPQEAKAGGDIPHRMKK